MSEPHSVELGTAAGLAISSDLPDAQVPIRDGQVVRPLAGLVGPAAA